MQGKYKALQLCQPQTTLLCAVQGAGMLCLEPRSGLAHRRTLQKLKAAQVFTDLHV